MFSTLIMSCDIYPYIQLSSDPPYQSETFMFVEQHVRLYLKLFTCTTYTIDVRDLYKV